MNYGKIQALLRIFEADIDYIHCRIFKLCMLYINRVGLGYAFY